MYVAEITFKQTAGNKSQADQGLYSLLVDWRNNGQILGSEWPIGVSTACLTLRLLVPERTALAVVHNNKSVHRSLRYLKLCGLSRPRVRMVGRDLESLSLDSCRRRKAYILTTSHLTLESPLQCGDCHGMVPLYRIPQTDGHGSHNGIRYWESLYQTLDGLWIASGAGERFAYRQLANHNSELSMLGRGICDKIRELTNVPTYYYLYRYHGRSLNQDRKRRCPGCGGKWLLSEPWYHYDFRCDRCLLVSEIAQDL